MNTDRESNKLFLDLPSARNAILIPTAAVSICTAIGGLMPFLADSIEDGGGLLNVIGFNLLSTLAISLLAAFIQEVLVVELKKRYQDNTNVLFLLDTLNRIAQITPIVLGPLLSNTLFNVPFFAAGLSMISGMTAVFAMSFLVAGLKLGFGALFEQAKSCITASHQS